MQNKVYFAHGKESGPRGTKIRALSVIAERHGCEVHSPDYRHTYDPEERVAHLLSLKPRAGGRLMLVGSSLGGYVSTVASAELNPAGLFLMAPALYIPGVNDDRELPVAAGHIEIVHGWGDDVVPVEQSLRFGRRHGAMLHLIDAGHTLNEVLPDVETLFERFLRRLLAD